MKLASLKHGRDGRLLVVSRDLTRSTDASSVAPTLQAALDDWDRSRRVCAHWRWAGERPAPSRPFVAEDCAAPLPRAYQWADGSAYVNHVELVRKARGAEMPASFWTDPLIYQGGSDVLLGARDPIAWQDEAWGIDFEAEVAVITGDMPLAPRAHAPRVSGWSCWSTMSPCAISFPGNWRKVRLLSVEAAHGLLSGRGDA